LGNVASTLRVESIDGVGSRGLVCRGMEKDLKRSRAVCFFLLSCFVFLGLDSQAQHSIQITPKDKYAGLYLIFSDILQGSKGCYNYNNGWSVTGPDSPAGYQQSVAMKFTPRADAKVTKLMLALVWIAGDEGAVISLNDDNNGVPGNAIHTWVIHKLENEGNWPCVYTVVKSKKGLPVPKGQQYWVVAAATGTEMDAWGYTYKYANGDFAYDLNNAGWKIEDAPLSAFAVWGTR
jgi:hypothetical protein